jgi:Cys-tRNA(Pro)/Cys-tRNA(Cys) deacylase
MTGNNVTRLLDSKKIPHIVFTLPREKISAMETAELLSVAPELVYKTIVIRCDKPAKPILAIVSGPDEVDLKKVAATVGEKKVHLPTQREAEQITGLLAGGISPLALLNKGFQILLDESALNHIEIHISGGQRGVNIRLPVDALVQLTKAKISRITI